MTIRFPIRDSQFKIPLGSLVIVLLTLGVYLPALRGGFVWDDISMLTDNPLVKAPDGLRYIWFSTRDADCVPLTLSSFWLEWRTWGMNPVGYHITNVLLHGLGAILFWRVLLRLGIPGAWLAAMVFAVHPVCVASVAWIAERKNTLSLVFFLSSILWYLRFDSGPRNTQDATRKWYGLSLAAFFLALASKASAAVMPGILLECVWWRRGRIAWRDVRRILPFFVLALAQALMALWIQHRAISVDSVQRDPFGVRLLGGSRAVWFYLGKVLWPTQLSLIYPRWEIHPASMVEYVPSLLWVIAITFCWRFRLTWGKATLFGLGYFFVTLLPVLGFFDMAFFAFSRVSDHFQYLAIIGIVALVIGGLRKLTRNNLMFSVIAVALVFSLSIMTLKRASIYTSNETVLRDTLAKNPACWMWHGWLGKILLDRHEFDEAIQHFREVLKYAPRIADAHNNWGLALLWQGKTDEAIIHFQAALRIDPFCALAHANLGEVLLGRGELDEAAKHFVVALRTMPDPAKAHNALGIVLVRQRKVAEALAHFQRALELGVEPAEAHHNLGNAFNQQGQTAEAVVHYRAALKLQPDLLEVLNNLGWLLATSKEAKWRNGAEAMQLATRAVVLTRTNDPGALDTLAAACAEAGQFEDAVATAKKAISLAELSGDRTLADEIKTRLRLYEQSQPFRESSAR